MKKKDPTWHILIDHISETWKIKKRAEVGYPFTGRDFRDLKVLGHVYTNYGVMALWDVFMGLENDFNAKTGYSLWQFQRQLPFLTDDVGWRHRRDKYRDQYGEQEMRELFNSRMLFELKEAVNI